MFEQMWKMQGSWLLGQTDYCAQKLKAIMVSGPPPEQHVSFNYVSGVFPKTGSLILLVRGQYVDLLSLEDVAQ